MLQRMRDWPGVHLPGALLLALLLEPLLLEPRRLQCRSLLIVEVEGLRLHRRRLDMLRHPGLPHRHLASLEVARTPLLLGLRLERPLPRLLDRCVAHFTGQVERHNLRHAARSRGSGRLVPSRRGGECGHRPGLEGGKFRRWVCSAVRTHRLALHQSEVRGFGLRSLARRRLRQARRLALHDGLVVGSRLERLGHAALGAVGCAGRVLGSRLGRGV
mmetsp:Transcript_6393/g.20493  ORF Transcript_6393/g.20493 Transcript_6393/m.20493 type:complete len:216 (+) Transcript_6393:996-1643(+)